MLKRLSLLTFLLPAIFIIPHGLHARYQNPPTWKRPQQACCQETERSWVDLDYLYWKIKDSPQDIPLIVEGALPSSHVVLGGKNIDTSWRSGGRAAVGYWIDNTHRLGGEVSYTSLPNVSVSKSISSDGSLASPILSVPFFNTLTGLNDFASVARPGLFEGNAHLKLKNCMQSAELNVIATMPCDKTLKIIFVAGLRYWSFYESLTFTTNSPFVPPLEGDIYKTKDHFLAQNNFYGGQVGASLNYSCNRFFMDLQIKVALGTMHQRAEIKGHLTTNHFNGLGAAQTFPGGYFTVPSNMRKRKNDPFATIPEVNIEFGYQLTDNMIFQIGYHALFANNVLWAGKLMDKRINPSQSSTLSNTATPVLVGEPLPTANLKPSNFWAHGLTVGMRFEF